MAILDTIKAIQAAQDKLPGRFCRLTPSEGGVLKYPSSEENRLSNVTVEEGYTVSCSSCSRIEGKKEYLSYIVHAWRELAPGVKEIVTYESPEKEI